MSELKEHSDSGVEISAIVVVGARADDVRALYAGYRDALIASGRTFEMLFVLDGDRKEIRQELSELQEEGEGLTVIRLAKSFGESAALMVGFGKARGHTILTLPAYNQILPVEIGKVLDARAEVDFVAARRWPRRGGVLEKLRRDGFHWLVRVVTGAKLTDLGCGIRAFDRHLLEEISIYGDQHRFLPILAVAEGFSFREVDVEQSPADEFRGNYRIREYAHRIIDLVSVFFLVRFTKKPLRLFGMVGAVIFSLGAFALSVVVIQKFFFFMPLADRPALLLSSLMVVLGLQLFALGLLGELIIFVHSRRLREYRIAEILE